MSQPLTGVIRRRWSELPAAEYGLLMSLADMVDSNNREWACTWNDLANRAGRPLRTMTHSAYRLRDKGWLRIRSTGQGIVITITPESGTSLRRFGRQPIADQKGNGLPIR